MSSARVGGSPARTGLDAVRGCRAVLSRAPAAPTRRY